MDKGGFGKPDRLLQRVAKWKHVGGGVDKDGKRIEKPVELQYAEIIESLALHYSATPSQILKEDVSVLKMLELLNVDKQKG